MEKIGKVLERYPTLLKLLSYAVLFSVDDDTAKVAIENDQSDSAEEADEAAVADASRENWTERIKTSHASAMDLISRVVIRRIIKGT